MRTLRIDTVRGRLTAFYVTALGLALLVVGGLIYVLLARALYARIDEGLHAAVATAATSLANDLAEQQGVDDAAASTVAELSSRQRMLAIFDAGGRLLADGGRDDDLIIELPPLSEIPSDDEELVTVAEHDDEDDRHRLAIRRVRLPSYGVEYIVVAGASLEPTDEELESLRGILAYVVPIALLIAGGGGWILARQSLAPVGAMADGAARMSAGDLGARLPVANPHDELGRLAATFNGLLARLESALAQQRQFMADASHELRTPVATVRSAAHVTLQQPQRPEAEYRDALRIVEQQTLRLSRIVDDMFTLARADTGSYPVRQDPMYLDETLSEAVRAARVLAAARGVRIELDSPQAAAFAGDEDLIRRLVTNLLDNAVRYAPDGSAVEVALRAYPEGYAIDVRDRGPGVPEEVRPHIFERFYRGDASRTTAGDGSGTGAGLGLALVRWIARVHGGDVRLESSSPQGSLFRVDLPIGS